MYLCSPAFIDTLSSCQRDGTQESYLSSFFFFFKTKLAKSGALQLAWLVQNTLRLTRIFFPKVCTCYVCNVVLA